MVDAAHWPQLVLRVELLHGFEQIQYYAEAFSKNVHMVLMLGIIGNLGEEIAR